MNLNLHADCASMDGQWIAAKPRLNPKVLMIDATEGEQAVFFIATQNNSIEHRSLLYF